jgi:hypothetical protein
VKRAVWWVYVAIVVMHGLIHLMGVAEGWGLADVEQLTEPVSAGAAVLWLVAALAVLAAAVLTAVRARWWWLVTAVAAVVSQVAILTSWGDARAGTAANVLMLAAAAYGFATRGAAGPRR